MITPTVETAFEQVNRLLSISGELNQNLKMVIELAKFKSKMLDRAVHALVEICERNSINKNSEAALIAYEALNEIKEMENQNKTI